eukprot:gb/GEZN01010890.1/.p1 GENE.gb/GEZN01010890.1/~~gb/GEZN01010890.1/.p1  ORF type:complete len:227 (-),score=33.57 gb/GEZN01010890.1/:522-1139(-)
MSSVDGKKLKTIPIVYRDVTKDNIGQVRRLNETIFPVQYGDKFYSDLLKEEDHELIQLVYHSDILIGAVLCRVEKENKEKESKGDTDKGNDGKSKHPKAGGSARGGGRKKLYIMTLGVLAPYRNLGIGTKMLEKILAYVDKHKQIKQVFLHVQPTNQEAIKLYEKYHFKVSEHIQNYYKRIEPKDCYIMSCSFNESETTTTSTDS